MATSKIPHILLPFQFVGTTVATVEQDTPDEIMQCVETIMRYVPGDRPELPEFGVPDQTFLERPDTDEMLEAITRFEPRASAAITDDFLLDQFVARVNVTVERNA